MAKQYRILVVEDDDAASSVLELILRSASFEVQRAAGGRTALDLIQKGGFDLVLLDLMLPEMSGEDLLKQLNADPRFKGFPVLVNSTTGDMPSVKKQIKACDNLRVEILPRPAGTDDLVETIKELLGTTAPSVSGSTVAPKMKVLVVDDDQAVRTLYVPYFAKKGYDVSAAANGREALGILNKEKVDLIILDLNMPEMTGEEVLEAMASHPNWKEIPIIIDTAVSPTSGRLDVIKKAFSGKLHIGFFERPTSLEELNEAIGRILIL
jgi:CheY-like chemotaxis protein